MAEDGRIGGVCAACGLAGHRFGTTDDTHEYMPVACINGLRERNQELTEIVARLAAMLAEREVCE